MMMCSVCIAWKEKNEDDASKTLSLPLGSYRKVWHASRRYWSSQCETSSARQRLIHLKARWFLDLLASLMRREKPRHAVRRWRQTGWCKYMTPRWWCFDEWPKDASEEALVETDKNVRGGPPVQSVAACTLPFVSGRPTVCRSLRCHYTSAHHSAAYQVRCALNTEIDLTAKGQLQHAWHQINATNERFKCRKSRRC